MKDIIDLDVNKFSEFFERKYGKGVPFNYATFRSGIDYAIEQMQPYFDAIGAGGVSGQRIARQCKHRFMWFGDQKKRRCADCCMIELSGNSGELPEMPSAWPAPDTNLWALILRMSKASYGVDSDLAANELRAELGRVAQDYASAALAQQANLQAEVMEMVWLMEANEWADHCGKSELGKRLEWAITRLHNQIAELKKSLSQQQAASGDDWFGKNDPFRDVIDAALAAQKSRQQNIPEIIPDAMRQGSSQAVGLDERSAFEAWASGFEIYLGKHKKTGQYVSAEASIAYNAWKARSSIENRKDGAAVKHSLTTDHIPDAGKMISEIDNDFIKEHADALNAPSGFTSHEASAWAIGVEHGMRVALDRA